jgi:hypothetical protein
MNQEISRMRKELRDLWMEERVSTRVAFRAIDYTDWLLTIRTYDICDLSCPYPESSMLLTDEFPDGLPPQEAFDFISKYIKSNGRYVKTN